MNYWFGFKDFELKNASPWIGLITKVTGSPTSYAECGEYVLSAVTLCKT